MKDNFKNRRIAVLGLGIEGKDIVRFLLGKGADITIFDQKREKELDFEGIDKNKVKLILGKDYLSKGFLNFDVVFRSPGVYRLIPPLLEAEKAGVEISSAIKLFFDLCPARIIGVTGTKGKGTTASLIYKILKSAGKDVYLAGNIGKPYLELLPKVKDSSWVVLELSSFQLIDMQQSPHIAVILNITIDHLDWHKDKKEYVEAKTHIVKHQKEDDFAVVNTDYKTSRVFAKLTKGRVLWFSRKEKVKGCYVKGGKIILNLEEKDEVIDGVEKLLLRGEHNWENVTAAICASSITGASLSSIKKTIYSFRGLEHRLELVGKVKQVTFYNDSFATSPQPTIAAVKSFNEPITLILGGSEKGLDYTNFGKEIANRKNIKTIVLIGEVAPKIKNALLSAGFSGRILELDKSKMEVIARKAFAQTSKGGVVLLSPAAASFDMFENYKDRGNQFKEAVGLLKQNG